MVDKRFDLLRFVEDAIKLVEEVTEPPRGDDRQPPPDEAQSGKPRNAKSGPSLKMSQVAGLAAAGLFAIAHHAVRKNTPAGARDRQRKQERRDSQTFQKELMEHFYRNAKEAERDEAFRLQTIHEQLSKKELVVKSRSAILVVNPSEEQLLDAMEAKRFFTEARSELAEARAQAARKVRQIIPPLLQTYLEGYPDDPSFEASLTQACKSWEFQNGKQHAYMMRRLENLEAALANIRDARTRGTEQADQAFSEQRLLFAPVGRPITAVDLERLSARTLQPRDARIAALFENLVEQRIKPAAVESALAEFAWNATALADILERAVLRSRIASHFGTGTPQQAHQIERLGRVCQTALWNIAPQELMLEGEDAVRIAAALIADFESPSPLIHVISWRALAPVIAGMREKLRSYVTRDEARTLLERLEGPALVAVDAALRKQGRERVFAPYADLMRDLAAIARISRVVPALEQWEQFLSQREAARAQIMAMASPFWAPLLGNMLDAERCDPRTPGAKERKVYDLLQGFAALSDSQMAVVAHEIKAILSNDGALHLAARDEGWIALTARFGSDTVAGHALRELQALLDQAPTERAAYFAPLAQVAALGDFAPYHDAQQWGGGNPVLETEIGDLLSAGAVDAAEARLRDWLCKAPEHPLRSSVLATRIDSMRLTGWDAFANVSRDPAVGALMADFSGHCVYNMLDSDSDLLWFEDGSIAVRDYDFTAHSLDEIRALGRHYPKPWQGCAEISGGLRLRGLAPVLRARRKNDAVTRPDIPRDHVRLQKAITDLTETWCFAAFAVALRRCAEAQPLARPIPVILGTHDFGWGIPDVIF